MCEPLIARQTTRVPRSTTLSRTLAKLVCDGRLLPSSVSSVSEPEERRTAALEEARKRRKTLHDSLVALEVAISSPAAGRIPDWTAVVLKEMVGVRNAFDQHVVVTEKPEGLYEEILGRAPRLEHALTKLKGEHPDIAEAITTMVARLEQVEVGGVGWPLDDARDDIQRFIGQVIRHRQKGADLVWEAYNVDIGGTE